MPSFGPLLMGQLHSPNVNHYVLHFQPKGRWEPHSEVGSLSLTEHLVGFELGTFRFFLQYLNPLRPLFWPFFGFLRLDLSPWGYRNRCLLVALCQLIVRRPNLEVATKSLLSSVGKNTGIGLVLCCTWKCVPTSMSGGVDISEVPGCRLLW